MHLFDSSNSLIKQIHLTFVYRKNVFDERKVKAITWRFIEVMFVLVSILDDLL